MTDKLHKDIKATRIESNYDEITESFDAMTLNSDLLRGVYTYGFETPSAVQQRAIMPMIKGNNVITQAQSHTGKTAAFSISILQRINPSLKACQAVVLAPTWELAQQIHDAIVAIGQFMDIGCHACTGPASFKEDIKALENGPQVVVGTPGRIWDIIQGGVLRIDNMKIFVLDEADKLLSCGFTEQIYNIFPLLPHSTQVVLVSATRPQDILTIITKFSRDPVQINVKKHKPTLEGIKQFYIAIKEEEYKLDILSQMYETIRTFQAIIFCSTRRKVELLASELATRGFPISAIHGDMDADHRCGITEKFRSGSSRILIATDLLARGIDVQQVSLVINFDLPAHRENYIYRVGWGGKSGRKGIAINFVTANDMCTMCEIEQFYNTHIEPMPVNVAVEAQDKSLALVPEANTLLVPDIISDRLAPTAEEKQKLQRIAGSIPWVSYLLCIVELVERASFYGCKTVFNDFLQFPLPEGGNGAGAIAKSDPNGHAGTLNQGLQFASATVLLFNFLAYMLPIFGAWLGDTKTGRFRAITYGVIIGGVAHVIMVGGVAPVILKASNGLAPFMTEYIKTLNSSEKVVVDPETTIQSIMLISLCIIYILLPVLLMWRYKSLKLAPPQESDLNNFFKIIGLVTRENKGRLQGKNFFESVKLLVLAAKGNRN
ncbi:hypothetical protein ACHAQD_009246 [Fusarium lateritium]